MRFRYVAYAVSRPVVSLSGRLSRPRPIIPVTFIGPTGVHLRDALLDTGADDTIIPDILAPRLGINLARAPRGVAMGLGGQPIGVCFARLSLRLTDGVENRVWQAWVAFAALQPQRTLLGFSGGLQYFSAHFHGDLEEVELRVNSQYHPGT